LSNVKPDPFYSYRALDDAILSEIVKAKLAKLKKRYADATGKTFEFESRIVAAVLARCRGAGARDVENGFWSDGKD
jgi:type VI secretion system protein VasG